MNIPHHHGESQFVITNDVGHRISGLRSLGLKTPNADDPIFKEFHTALVNRVECALPEIKVVSYDMTDLADEVWSQALKLKSDLASEIVVSTCAELAATRRGHTIEMNRIVDVNGDIIGFGPRPGNPLLKKQIASIAEFARGKSVVLAEDGAFSGSTVDYLVKKLQVHGVEVSAVVVGICFPTAVENLSKSFNGRLMVIRKTEKPYEWMPDHDFLPFVPNCGRVFGSLYGDEGVPCYIHDGTSFSFPYILPFGDPTKWASIPREHAVSFSQFCLEQALVIYKCLDEMNNRRLTVRDLSGSTPRVSMPMTMGSSRLPELDYSISGFIAEVLHEF